MDSRPDFCERMVRSLASVKLQIPVEELRTMGVKNISTYRSSIFSVIRSAKLPTKELFHLLLAMMKVKSRKHLIAGFAKMKITSLDTNKIISFLVNYTCDRTQQQTENKVCTLKFPESLPDFCALVFRAMNEENDGSALAGCYWAASLHLADDSRNVNRIATMHYWNNVVKISTFTNKETKFDEKIYEQQCQDKIPLINERGEEWAPSTHALTLKDLDLYMTKGYSKHPAYQASGSAPRGCCH
ncbi:hypothetical protein MMPV_007383 [Pyropia vietnamensis]